MTSPPSERRPLPRIIAVANQKGGVGKTTTTINLGACLAELGYRTLLVDLDPQGNASTGLGIDNRGLETSMYHVIMHEVPLENCIEPTSVKNLFVAPASLDLAGAEIELVPAFSRENRLRRAIEADRIQRQMAIGQFDKPVFPVLEGMAGFDVKRLAETYAAFRADIDRMMDGEKLQRIPMS